MLGRYSLSENWYWNGLRRLGRDYPSENWYSKAGDKRNKALTMLGLAEKVQTQKSPPINRGAQANIVSLGFLLTFVDHFVINAHGLECRLDAVQCTALLIAQAIHFGARLVKRGQFLDQAEIKRAGF